MLGLFVPAFAHFVSPHPHLFPPLSPHSCCGFTTACPLQEDMQWREQLSAVTGPVDQDGVPPLDRKVCCRICICVEKHDDLAAVGQRGGVSHCLF